MLLQKKKISLNLFLTYIHTEVLYGFKHLLFDKFLSVKTSNFNRNLHNLEFCERVKDFTALYRIDQQKAA